MPDVDLDEQPTDDESPVIKQLREQADKSTREVKALRTENALLQAGLGNLTEIQRKATLATHEGDITADALKATATSLGFTVPAPDVPDQQVPDDEQAAHKRVQEATGGAEPAAAHEQTLADRIAATSTKEELDALMAQEGTASE